MCVCVCVVIVLVLVMLINHLSLDSLSVMRVAMKILLDSETPSVCVLVYALYFVLSSSHVGGTLVLIRLPGLIVFLVLPVLYFSAALCVPCVSVFLVLLVFLVFLCSLSSLCFWCSLCSLCFCAPCPPCVSGAFVLCDCAAM